MPAMLGPREQAVESGMVTPMYAQQSAPIGPEEPQSLSREPTRTRVQAIAQREGGAEVDPGRDSLARGYRKLLGHAQNAELGNLVTAIRAGRCERDCTGREQKTQHHRCRVRWSRRRAARLPPRS